MCLNHVKNLKLKSCHESMWDGMKRCEIVCLTRCISCQFESVMWIFHHSIALHSHSFLYFLVPLLPRSFMSLSVIFLQEDTYNLFYANNNWYIFFRLHHKLCIRLLYYRNLSEKIAQEEASSKVDRKHSTAVALRLRSPREYWFIVICIYSNIALFVCCDGGFGGGGGCVYVRERVKDDRLLWF